MLDLINLRPSTGTTCAHCRGSTTGQFLVRGLGIPAAMILLPETRSPGEGHGSTLWPAGLDAELSPAACDTPTMNNAIALTSHDNLLPSLLFIF